MHSVFYFCLGIIIACMAVTITILSLKIKGLKSSIHINNELHKQIQEESEVEAQASSEIIAALADQIEEKDQKIAWDAQFIFELNNELFDAYENLTMVIKELPPSQVGRLDRVSISVGKEGPSYSYDRPTPPPGGDNIFIVPTPRKERP